MNKEIFRHMQEQLEPSAGARAALREKLDGAEPRRRSALPWAAAGLTACAVLALVIAPLALRDRTAGEDGEVDRPPHSYVTGGPAVGGVTATEGTDTGDAGAGDRDMGMTPMELREAMLEAGFSELDAETASQTDRVMTWATWWKYFHASENEPRTAEGFLSWLEAEGPPAAPEVNTGDLSEAEAASRDQQGALQAHQRLMTQLGGALPDWYGGCFINDRNDLQIQIVSGYDAKELALSVLDWTAAARVSFGECKYSLRCLKDLQQQVYGVLGRYHLGTWGLGVNEKEGRLELTIERVNDDFLRELAALDPEDDAITVIVGEAVTLE